MLRSGTVNAGEAFRFRASAIADQSTYAGNRQDGRGRPDGEGAIHPHGRPLRVVPAAGDACRCGAAWWGSGDPIRALAVLVVATPCPLILAAPVAFIGGVSRAAREGVLMKGSAALEALAQVRTAIFDKTGTLTEGGAHLIAIETAPGISADEALRLLASLEQASHHVLSDAVLLAARDRGLPLSRPTGVREYRGAGLEGRIDGLCIRAGSRALVVGDAPLPPWAEHCRASSKRQSVLTVFLTVDGKLCAVFDLGRRNPPRHACRHRQASRVRCLAGDDGDGG